MARTLRLLIEDVTLPKTDKIPAHVRLRGGTTRTLVLERPLPIAQIRKTKPEILAEIDTLLNDHCDREVAEILNQRGHRTWHNLPFTLKKIAWIRMIYRLKSRFGRLREQGLLTAKEMTKALAGCGKTQYGVKMPSKSLIENLHPRLTDRSWGILVRSIFGGFCKVEFSRSLLDRSSSESYGQIYR